MIASPSSLPSNLHALAGVGAPPPIPRWWPDRVRNGHMEDPSLPASPARRCPAMDDPAFFDGADQPDDLQDEWPAPAAPVLN